MNICVQIILCFTVYVSFYRIYSNSRAGTSSYCHNEDIDDVNETIELDHDIEGLEEILSLPCDILEALNGENEGSKPRLRKSKSELDNFLFRISPSISPSRTLLISFSFFK